MVADKETVDETIEEIDKLYSEYKGYGIKGGKAKAFFHSRLISILFEYVPSRLVDKYDEIDDDVGGFYEYEEFIHK